MSDANSRGPRGDRFPVAEFCPSGISLWRSNLLRNPTRGHAHLHSTCVLRLPRATRSRGSQAAYHDCDNWVDGCSNRQAPVCFDNKRAAHGRPVLHGFPSTRGWVRSPVVAKGPRGNDLGRVISDRGATTEGSDWNEWRVAQFRRLGATPDVSVCIAKAFNRK